ncbi:MAG: hypothetical protein HY006_03410 [Candidatus Sungbacteria bacterium]|nr:hypothetical protein [Candidatus Sungbacteria bacterium]
MPGVQAVPFRETSETFGMICDSRISRQRIADVLRQRRSEPDLPWEVWRQTEEQFTDFLQRPDMADAHSGLDVYKFVQFTEPLDFPEAIDVLKAKGYQPCDFRHLLLALVLSKDRINLPMETRGGNTRGDMVVLGETAFGEDNPWLPGAQVSYHEVDSWRLLLARNWNELMTEKWRGHWHVLTRLGGTTKAWFQFFLWYNQMLVK